MIEQALYFKGLSQAIAAVERGDEARAEFRGSLSTDKSATISGTFSPYHLTCTTARVRLRGRANHWLLGQVVDVRGREIKFRPVLIADRIYTDWPDDADELPVDLQNPHPSHIDAFREADWSKGVSDRDLEVLREIPEHEIKKAFAKLVGEPVVPKDWSGERSDLWTTRLRLGGRFRSAAFLFKGPSHFKPMTIRALGKNGDQIDRLAQEPAEVLIVQHCHRVRAEVVSMLRAYASDFRRPRQFIVIDGYDTLRILRLAGAITRPRARKSSGVQTSRTSPPIRAGDRRREPT